MLDLSTDDAITLLHGQMAPLLETWRTNPGRRGEGALHAEIVSGLARVGSLHGMQDPWCCEERIGFRLMPDRVHRRDVTAFEQSSKPVARAKLDGTIRWHLLQTRSGRKGPKEKCFTGDGLYDPVTAAWLETIGKGSAEVRLWISQDADYGRQSHLMVTRSVIGHFKGILELHVFRNEVRAKAMLAKGISWTRGYLTFDNLDIPETMMLSLKGRPLDDLLAHPFTTGRGLMMRSIGLSTSGKTTIGTTGDAVAALEHENPTRYN